MPVDSSESNSALSAMGVRTDEDLMAAYASGDMVAFGLLLPRFADRLWGYFAKTFRDRAVADDLYQTTLLKLHGARASYRTGAPFRPWLFGIASRVRVDELRRRYRVENDAEYAARNPSVANDPESAQRDRIVRDALAALPESQREVVMLHRYAGLSFSEIGMLLADREGGAVAEGTVRARAFRAYAKLREILADWAPERPASSTVEAAP
jgi:RNA polymerase sigma factor (sigma-70 family)